MKPVLENMFRKEEGKTGSCYVETSNEMSALLELILSRSQQNGHEDLPTFNPENFTFSQASAHKRLLPRKIQSCLSDLPEFPKEGYISLWLDTRTTDPKVEHDRNVAVNPWGYNILRSGLYYVYSSLLYEPSSNKPCGDFDEQTWEHVIVVGRFGDKQNSGIVARSVHTCCDNCIGIKETSYAGHNIFLNKGDTLSVQVSGAGLVRFRKESTFFGLFMISGKD